MQYILPKSLLEPIYHCFYYFEVMNVSKGVAEFLKKSNALSVDWKVFKRVCIEQYVTSCKNHCKESVQLATYRTITVYCPV